MKATRVRTLRGTVTLAAGGSGKRQLIVEDGLINRGYKIERIYVWSPTNLTAWKGILTTRIHVGFNPDAADNNQIGWFNKETGTIQDNILDPDHVAVKDLFINLLVTGGGAGDTMNYMIVMQQYDLSDEEAIIQISKEDNQASSPA